MHTYQSFKRLQGGASPCESESTLIWNAISVAAIGLEIACFRFGGFEGESVLIPLDSWTDS